MPKRQKIYRSREQILKDIDAAHRKIKRLEIRAQTEINAEKECLRQENNQYVGHRHEADRLLGKISRLRNTRLKKLGATLAEFDTTPLQVEGLNVEQSVLQKL